MDYLKAVGIYAWRNNTGGMFKHGHFYRFGKPGSSDILGILDDGRFLAIEVKRPGKEPTEVQREFLENINKNGGLAFVAYSVDDARSMLGL